MSEGSRRTALVLGAIAGAAGVAAASYYLAGRYRASRQVPVEAVESVAEVLSQCYTRLKEIQDHLQELDPPAQPPRPKRQRA